MFKFTCVLGAVFCCLSVAACKQAVRDVPAEAVPVAEARPDSWIGVELAALTPPQDVISADEVVVKVVGVMIAAPADGILKEDDILVKVGGQPVTDIVQTIDRIKGWPAGQDLEVTVRRGNKEETLVLRPQSKPAPTALLNRAYLGRPLEPFTGAMISVAEVDAQDRVVPGSQCVMEYGTACPKFGRLGATDLTVGKATVLLFWSQDGTMASSPAFSVLKDCHERFGARGLEIVAITRDAPRTLMPYLKNVPHPPMTLISMWLGNYRSARLAESLAPSVLVLDEKGVVRAAAGTVADMEALANQTLPELLGTAER